MTWGMVVGPALLMWSWQCAEAVGSLVAKGDGGGDAGWLRVLGVSLLGAGLFALGRL